MRDFYRKFEDRYRGSRSLIKERLKVYLPFVRPLCLRYPQSEILDLGCGRGEWLELLEEEGFNARGVDLDKGMLAACKELGLNAEFGDAIDTFKKIPDDSVSVVSAFHFVEHIDFDHVITIIKESARVLVPGGLLILETPNTENITVGTLYFYLDPTHFKPIPSLLLSFVAEYCGFERIKVLRLQELKNLHDENFDISLMDVVSGVSPDYSIVAQKTCDESFGAMFDDVFSKKYGLTLDELAERYETGVRSLVKHAMSDSDQHWQKNTERLCHLEREQKQTNMQLDAIRAGIEVSSMALKERDATIGALRDDLHERNIRIDQLSNELAERNSNIEALIQDGHRRNSEIEQLSQKADELVEQVKISKQSAHHWWMEYDKLHMEMEQLKNTLTAIYESGSWRITAPLRWLKTVTINRCWRSIKVRLKFALRKLAAHVNRHRIFRRAALQIIHRVPGIRLWLVRTIGQTSMQPAQKDTPFKVKQKTEIHHKNDVPANMQHLTQHARRVYKTLRTELMHRSEEKH